MGSITPAVHAIPPLMGVAAYLALHNLWIWLGRRREPLHLWVSLWCANSLLYLASHYLQIASALPEHAVLGGRLAWTSAIVLIVMTIGLSHALAGAPPPRRLMWSGTIVNAGLLLLVWLTGAIVSGRAYVRTDVLGYQYGAPVPGPLLPLLAPYILVVFAYAWRTLGRGEMDPGERRAIRAGFAVYIVLALNDMLHAARLIQSIRVFDLGFVAVGVGLTYMLVRRYNRLHTHLEEEVSVRGREAHARSEEMAALLRAGQSVLSGLDLEETLGRIVREASRIAATPHVKLLLVDREAGVLRMGAVSRGTVPPDFEVPLGQSYSGTIAATGEMLFVPDTQSDPRNLLAQRDREQGIRTFLGLPVKIRDEVLGVLTFNTEHPHEYSPAELKTLSSFADTAALAIDNARLYEAARRREMRLATLATVTQSLTATLSVQEVLHRVVERTVTLFDSSVSRLWLLDDEGQTLTLRAHAGDRAAVDTATTLRLGEGFVGRITKTCSALVVDDVWQDPRPENAARLRAEGIASFAGVPVTIGGQVLGALGIGTREPRRFREEELSLLQSLANSAAIAIANARLHEGLARRLERLETLTRLNRALSSSLDRDTVLKEITRSAAQLMQVRGASFWLADEAAGTLALVGFSDPALEADLPARVMMFDRGLLGWIATQQRLVNVADVFTDARFLNPAWWRGHGLTSFVGVPVVHGGSVVGVLGLAGAQPIHLAAEDETILGAFVVQAAVAIQNASLYESARARAQEIGALHEVGAALVSSLDLASVLGAITASAMELTGAGGSAVFELGPDEGLLRLRAARGIDESRTPTVLRLGQGAAGAAALRREPVWSPDVSVQPLPGYQEEVPGSAEPLGERVRTLAYRGMLGIPLLSRDTVFGAICLYWYEAHTPEEQEIRLLTAFAQQAAVALENARLHAALGRRLGRVETLARLTRVLSSSLDRDRILAEIARAAAELAEARFVTIWLADETTQTLTLGSVSDPGINADWAPTTLPFGQSGVGWIAAHRRALRVDDSFADDRFLQPEWRRKHGLKAFLGLPVIHEGVLVAVLSLSGPQPFSREPEDEALLSAFTAQAAVAIGNASLYEAEGQARRAAGLGPGQGKQLQGMVPICAHCKKIRNEKN